MGKCAIVCGVSVLLGIFIQGCNFLWSKPSGFEGASMKANSRLKLPVIMATDCGADMDDQWALAHLVLSPEIDLRGVVTTHTGDYPVFTEPAAESSAGAAREVLDHLPLRSRPPVIAGSSRPLKDKAVPMLNPGVELILRESRGYGCDRRLTVVITGAATDVASALICDPSLQDRIEIVAMAFDKWPEGGDVFNVKNDTKAWQVLLESNAPIVVGDGEVTRKHLGMTPQRANELFHSCGPVGQYLAGLHASWITEHKDLMREFSGSENL